MSFVARGRLSKCKKCLHKKGKISLIKAELKVKKNKGKKENTKNWASGKKSGHLAGAADGKFRNLVSE